MDGWVTIGTKLDRKGLENDIKIAEKELQKYQKESESLTKQKAKYETNIEQYEAEIAEYDKLIVKAGEYENKIEALKKMGYKGTAQLVPTMEEYNKINDELDKQTPKIDKIHQKYEETKNVVEEINQKLINNKNEQQEISNKIQQTTEKLNKLNIRENITDELGNAGNKMGDILKKASRWVLAIFSIRSAYSLLSQASSVLSQYNQQYATDLQYIRFALAQAVAPVLEYVVQLAYKLLQYINYVLQAWFGINIFAKASANSFKNMQTSTAKSARNAEKIRKELQSANFDEMTILTESGATTGATSGLDEGISAPSVDLSNMTAEIPPWLEWIVEHKDLILNTLKAIGIAVAAMKIVSFLSSITGGLKGLVTGIGQFVESGKSLSAGIGLMIAGFALLVGSIVNLVMNWDNMTTREKIITIALAAIGAAFIALGYAIATGISVATLGIGALIAAIAAVIAAIIGFIAKLANEESAIKSVDEAEQNLINTKKELRNATEGYVNAVDNAENALDELEEAERSTGLSGRDLAIQVENGTLEYTKMTDAQKQVYKAYLKSESAQEDLVDATNALSEAKRAEKKASLELQMSIANETKNFDEYKKSVVEAFRQGEISADDARELLGKAMSEMSWSSQKTFMQDLPSDIKNGLDPRQYEGTWQKFKNDTARNFEIVGLLGKRLWERIKSDSAQSWEGIKNIFSKVGDFFGNIFQDAWNRVKNVFSVGGKIFDGIKEGIVNSFKKIVNAIISGINRVVSVPFNKLNGVINTLRNFEIFGNKPFGGLSTISVPQIPYLAKGTILNNPGKGTLVAGGSAIAGEAGREAYLPLSDKQLLEELGSTIGKYITINATVNNSMNGRLISRIVQKIKAEQDFAYNT